ncbi:LysM domain/BON superfamily protein [Phycisphaerae bacterium RAS1]|nr:LysM domain/BON superfamily protein [Phycisphaerae bacterium RAS1]
MVMSVKAALMVCLLFIGGMTWAVNQVALPGSGGGVIPTRAQPTTTGEPGDGAVKSRDVEAGRVSPDAFARPSAVHTPPSVIEPQGATEFVTLAPVDRDGPALPPLQRAIEPARDVALNATDDSLPSESQALVVAGVTDSPAETPAASNAAAAAFPRLVRVAAGESLSKIAKRELGSDDGRMVKLILAANPALRGRADRVLAGQELTIPDPNQKTVASAEPSRNPRSKSAAATPRRDGGGKAAPKPAARDKGKSGKSAAGRGGPRTG